MSFYLILCPQEAHSTTSSHSLKVKAFHLKNLTLQASTNTIRLAASKPALVAIIAMVETSLAMFLTGKGHVHLGGRKPELSKTSNEHSIFNGYEEKESWIKSEEEPLKHSFQVSSIM
jgi:hypothetical protein